MQYKAIFFDWDGTAVKSRKEPVDSVVELMKKLLSKDVKMIIISGTTFYKAGTWQSLSWIGTWRS